MSSNPSPPARPLTAEGRGASDPLTQVLVGALYATPSAILIGSVTVTTVMAGAGLISGHDPVFYGLAVLMALMGGCRQFVHGLYLRAAGQEDAPDPVRFERLAMVGAWGTAGLIAAFSCYALAAYPRDPVAVLAVAQSIGYLAGISGRNPTRPLIPKVQVLISGVPLTIALLATLEPAYIMIALTVMLTTILTFSSMQMIYEVFVSRQRTLEELETLANRDPLTGLSNRRALLVALDAAVRARRPFTLMSIDIDHFKTINDSFGHDMGDALLSVVAETLRGCIGPRDVCARIGGDEFVILTSGGEAEASELARRILTQVGSQRRIAGRMIAPTVSVGIVVADDTATLEDVLKRADIALYKAKSDGRNHFVLFSPELAARSDEEVAFERDFRDAMRAGQFELAYQPIYNPRSGTVTSVEALLRWNHPERGAISPAVFIPVAERTGLIKTLGAWTIETAALAALSWPSHIGVNVNVSARQFEKDHDIVGVVSSILRRTALPPSRLTLELTETTLLEDAPHIVERLTRLRNLGVKLALDDFGTGFSSLSYLAKLPIDTIKIDKAFSHEIEASPKAHALMSAITDLAHRLGLTVVAEGIETEAQLAVMDGFSLHGIQGFIFARPMAPSALAEILDRRVRAPRRERSKAEKQQGEGQSGRKRPRVA